MQSPGRAVEHLLQSTGAASRRPSFILRSIGLSRRPKGLKCLLLRVVLFR